MSIRSLRGLVQITIDGHFVSINATEIDPGKWGWTVSVDGAAPVGSLSPEATTAAALMAAETHARELIKGRLST